MLRAGVREYLSTLAEEPAFTHTLVIDAVGATPRILRRRAQAFRDFVRVLAIPIELARAQDPRVPEPDERTLLAVLGGINELVLLHLVAEDAATLPSACPRGGSAGGAVVLPGCAGRLSPLPAPTVPSSESCCVCRAYQGKRSTIRGADQCQPAGSGSGGPALSRSSTDRTLSSRVWSGRSRRSSSLSTV